MSAKEGKSEVATADVSLAIVPVEKDTAMKAAEAGLSGIVTSSGGVMVLDLPQVVAILDAQGMFLWVHP